MKSKVYFGDLKAQAGGDKIRGVYPEVECSVQLEYAEKIGLGQREYELIKIEKLFLTSQLLEAFAENLISPYLFLLSSKLAWMPLPL